jgi:hypothetical protein
METRYAECPQTSWTYALAWWCFMLAVMSGLACWLTRPLILGMWDHVYDTSDALYTVWALDHNYQIISSADWRNYWRAPMFTPYEYSLVLADAHLGTALWTFPAYRLTGSAVFAQNVAILGSFVGTGIASYLVATLVTRRSVLALVLATAAMAIPFRIAQLLHIQILQTQWLVLSVWCLLRCAQRPHAVYVIVFGVTVVLSLLSNLYYGVMQLFLLVPLGLILGLRGQWYKRDRLQRSWLYVGLLLAPLVTWFLLPYFLIYHLEMFEHRLSTVVYLSAKPRYWFDLSTHHVLANRLGFGNDGHEFALFPGMVLACGAVLSLIAIWRTRDVWTRVQLAAARTRRWIISHPEWALGVVGALAVLYCWLFKAPIGVQLLKLKHDGLPVAWRTLSATLLLVALFSGLVAAVPIAWSRGWIRERGTVFWCWMGLVLFVLFSFGPLIRHGSTDLAVGPYSILYRFVPGFQSMRVPARFCLLCVPLWILLAGISYDQFFATLPQRLSTGIAPISLVALLAIDLAVRPIAWQRVPLEDDLPQAVKWLRDSPERGAVLVLPLDYLRQPSPLYLYFSLFHRRPLLNGYPVFTPSEMLGVFPPLRRFPDPNAIEVLKQRGVRFVVIDQFEMSLTSRSHSPESFAELLDRSELIRKLPAGCDDRFLLYELVKPSE